MDLLRGPYRSIRSFRRRNHLNFATGLSNLPPLIDEKQSSTADLRTAIFAEDRNHNLDKKAESTLS